MICRLTGLFRGLRRPRRHRRCRTARSGRPGTDSEERTAGCRVWVPAWSCRTSQDKLYRTACTLTRPCTHVDCLKQYDEGFESNECRISAIRIPDPQATCTVNIVRLHKNGLNFLGPSYSSVELTKLVCAQTHSLVHLTVLREIQLIF